jgi:Secretion system C-terminal sorting domain
VNTNGCGSNCNAFIDALENNSYLWTYMAGGGTDTSCAGSVFTSDYCFTRTLNTVFMQLYGSYFVEWAKGGLPVPNNLLRAPLTNSGMPLATCWTGGGPRWYFHPMGLGETIGFATKLSQNNTTTYDPGNNQNLGGIHMALMGDPSLRLHVVYPISNLTISALQNNLQLDWLASNDSNIVGYNIYRSDSILGDFLRINTNPVTGLSFTDNAPSLNGTNLYMVRAIKLETASSGTYYNMSTGVFISSDTLNIQDNTSNRQLYLFPNPVSKQLYFSESVENFEVYSIYGQKVVSKTATAYSLNVESFQEGIYYVKTDTTFIKFIVKH